MVCYQIVLFCHPKKNDGYDLNTQHKQTIEICGEQDDEQLSKKCAQNIILQLARRDVLIGRVEVFKIHKEKVTFRHIEQGMGFILGNHKYMLSQQDSHPIITEHDDNIGNSSEQKSTVVSQNVTQHIATHENHQPIVKSRPKNIVSEKRQRRVLYQVVFQPEDFHIPELKKLKLNLTREKAYNVYETIPSKSSPGTVFIKIDDDTGKEIIVDEKFFVVKGAGLSGGFLEDKQTH